MSGYLPPAVKAGYQMHKHNGTWYEVAFRDLYPWGNVCFCQQSIKYVNEAQGYIDDYFVFTCGPGVPRINYISPQRENVTNAGTGQRHDNAAYDMYVRDSAFKFITHYEWNSQVIGYKDDGNDQYAWVIEFQCGTRPNLPKDLCVGHTASDGQCYFTGIQLYVRDLANAELGRAEMLDYIRGLGPATSASLGVAWVMTDFSAGTFPPWFRNDTYSDKCPFPCKSGVYNETTRMWGCPTTANHTSSPEIELRVARPFGPHP